MSHEEQSPFEEAAVPAASGGSLAHAIGARNLMIIIITMPLVFLIVVMATIAIFGRPGAEKDSDAAAERVVATLAQPEPLAAEKTGIVAPAPASLAHDAPPLILPPGADITAMALDGDHLALRIISKDGGEIVVYDLTTGAALSRLAVKRQVEAGADDEL